jgi:hypothetical protein
MPRKPKRERANGERPFVPQIPDLGSGSQTIEQIEESYVQRLAQANTPVAMQCLVEVASNMRRMLEPDDDGHFELELGDDGNPIVLGYTPGARVAAAKAIIEQGYGKPVQQVKHTGNQASGGVVVVIHQLSDGSRTAIDVTPTREQIGEGDPSPERVAAS